MSKQGKLYIVLVILTILSIVYLEYTKPKKVNWYPSYAKHHKIPFGTYILNEQMERLFGEDVINYITQPPFEYLFSDDQTKGTYVFINNSLHFGEAELERLLDWTAQGNSLFMAALAFDEKLLDTLEISTKVISTFSNFNQDYVLQLKNQQLTKDLFYFDKATNLFYFDKLSETSKVVGIIDNVNNQNEVINQEHVNIIKQPFGNGEILISTFPQAFTNYFLLKDNNRNYTAGLLSYMDNSQAILVDLHYKTGKTYYTSPLYILLNTKELKWAYYLLLIGAFLYVFFEGKRKQRAIPVVKPLRNQTLDFTRTIANMYYEKGQHKTMAMHKIKHFMDYIRTHWHLDTTTFDEAFLKQLSARSNNDESTTQKLINTIEQLRTKAEITQQELEELSHIIDDYKQKQSWKTTI